MKPDPSSPLLPRDDRPALKVYDPDGLGQRDDQIRDGDVLGFRTRGFWAAAIKLRTFSRTTHVGFAIRIRGQLFVLEAEERRGVTLYPFRRYVEDLNIEVDWYRLKASEYDINRSLLIGEALLHCGQAYASPWQFIRSFGLLSEPLCDKLGVPRATNPERFFCSHFVLSRLRNQGYRGNPDFDAAQASPGDVVELDCLEKGRKIA